MRKLLILGAVLLVMAGAVFLAAANANRYLESHREWLAQQASTALGRPVEFDAIGVSFRRGLGVRVSDVVIGEDSTFGKEAFLRATRIDAAIKILPALRGHYELARIEIDAPQINLIKSKGGFNFASIGRAKGELPPKAEAQTSPSRALPLLVSSLRIRDGRVQLVDRTASPASTLRVDQLDVSASDVGLDRPVSLEIAAAVLDAAGQNVRIAGTVGPPTSPEAFASAPVDLRIDLGPLVVDRLKKSALIGNSIPADLSSPDPVSFGVQLSGTLDALGTHVSMDVSDAAIAFGDRFTKPKGVRLKLAADVKLLADAVDVSKMELDVAEAHLIGKGRIGRTAGVPIDFEVSGNDLPLAGWGSLFPAAAAIETTGALDLQIQATGSAGSRGMPRLLGSVGLKGVSLKQPGGRTQIEGLTTTVALKGDRVEIPATEFKLNGNPVRVAATVKNLKDLDTDFTLTSPALDLAAVGAAGEGTKRRERLEAVEVRGNFRSASSGPQLDASIRSASGSVRDVDYRTLDGQASLRERKLTFERLSLTAFGGNINGAGRYDFAKPDAPGFAFRGKLDGIDVGALIARFGPGGATQMTGRLHGNLDVEGSGSEWRVIRETLVGNGALEVENGVLKGVNIAESILSSLTGIPGLSQLISPGVRRKHPELFGMDDTVFETLAGKMTLRDGKALLDELALAARDYRLDGKGSFALDNVLDVGLTFIASQNLTKDLLGSVKPLQVLTDTQGRFNLPLRLTGSLPSVRPLPDTQYVSQRLTGSLVESGIEKGLDALIGKPKHPKAGAEGETEQPAPQSDPSEELIRQGLDSLLRKGRK